MCSIQHSQIICVREYDISKFVFHWLAAWRAIPAPVTRRQTLLTRQDGRGYCYCVSTRAGAGNVARRAWRAPGRWMSEGGLPECSEWGAARIWRLKPTKVAGRARVAAQPAVPRGGATHRAARGRPTYTRLINGPSKNSGSIKLPGESFIFTLLFGGHVSATLIAATPNPQISGVF